MKVYPPLSEMMGKHVNKVFFSIPRRNLEAWRRELEDILDVAADDSEPWVQMLSELMKTYPSSGEASNPKRSHVSHCLTSVASARNIQCCLKIGRVTNLID